MEHIYLLAYDIADPKRLARVARIAYGYALGGQKSALECPIDQNQASHITASLAPHIDAKQDTVHLIAIKPEAITLGKATQYYFKDDALIL